MGKVKNWLMEMSEKADFALEDGARNADEVILAMRNAGMNIVDEDWVNQYVNERLSDA